MIRDEPLSLKTVYRRVLLRQRLCERCGRPIIRNLAIYNNVPYHFGCLKRSNVQPTWQCMNCFAYLTGPWTSLVEIDGRETRGCRLCGSTDIVRVRDFPWRAQAVEVAAR